MQKIEINTTQNVSIDFEIAPLRERIVAFIIDFIILVAGITIIMIIASMFIPSGLDYVYYIIAFPIFVFYSLAFEILNHGQSIGKKVTDLKVVKLSGAEPKSSDYLLRWTFRMIDIYFSFGTLASIFISSSARGQRLGDMAAETTVIKMKPSRILSFKDITQINSIDNYEPRYPLVKKLPEETMILVKNTLERANKYNNKAHREAVFQLSIKIREKLDITEQVDNHTEFLKTLINDYVVLTR